MFTLTRIATQLGAMKVEAEWVPPNIRDFEARRRQGIGRFATEADLAKEQNHDFSTVALMRFPGLTLVPDAQNNGRLILATVRDVRPCPVQVYLDGVRLGSEYPDWVRTWDLAAVEYYTGTQVPVQYRGGCGVFLLWSKWY